MSSVQYTCITGIILIGVLQLPVDCDYAYNRNSHRIGGMSYHDQSAICRRYQH